MEWPQVLDTDIVVRGGQSPLPEPGITFSGSYGPTLENSRIRGSAWGQFELRQRALFEPQAAQ